MTTCNIDQPCAGFGGRVHQPGPICPVVMPGWLDSTAHLIVRIPAPGDYRVAKDGTVMLLKTRGDLEADIAQVNELLDQFDDAVESKGATLREMDERSA